MGIINWQKPSWIWFIQLTAGFGGLLFALSCAVNRVQSHTTSANRSGIESGRLKGHEIACTPQKTRHPLSTGRSVRSKHMARYPYPVVSFRIRVRDGNSRSHHAKHDLLSVRSSNERIFPGFSNSQNIVKPEDPPKMADANSLFTFDRPGISLTYGVFLDNEGNFGIPGHSAPNPDGADCRRTRDQDLSNDPESFQVKETQSPFGVDIPEITRSQAVRPSGHEQRQSRPFSKTERSFFLLTLIAGVLSFLGFKSAPKLTGNLSFWAAMNPKRTRAIIAGIHMLTGNAGLMLGAGLSYSGTQFSGLSWGILAGTFLTSALLYPVRKSPVKLLHRTYLKQKFHDLALFLLGSLLMVYAGNQYVPQTHLLDNLFYADRQGQLHEKIIANRLPVADNKVFYGNDQIMQDDSTPIQKREMPKGVKVALSFLTVILFCVLAYLVLVLSCSLACSGMNGLAILAGLGGGALLVTLLILAMRYIWRPRNRMKKTISAS